MQYQEFKEKVNKLNEIFFDVIKTANAEMSDTIEDVTANLINNKDTQLVNLSDLEAKLNSQRNEKDIAISSAKSKILNLRYELEKQVKAYQNTHVYDVEKEKKFKEKDESLKENLQIIKKKIFEYNQTINSLDKECLLRLKENEKVCNDTVLEYENKILEIERKIRFETQRINDSILTPTTDADFNEKIRKGHNIETTDNEETLKENIRTLRYNGINEIFALKKKGFEEIKNLKMDCSKYSAVSHRDNEIVRAEYNLQIEAAKYEITKLKEERKQLNDNYDFDAYKVLNEMKQKFGLDENELISQYHNKIYAIDKEVCDCDYDKNICINNNAKEIIDVINQDNEIQYKQMIVYLENSINNFNQKVIATYQYIKEYLLSIFDVAFHLINEFWDTFKVMQNTFLNNIVAMSYKTHVLNGFTYEDFEKNMYKTLDNFQNLMQLRVESFQKTFNQNVSNIIRMIESNQKILLEYRDNEIEQLNKYKKEIESNYKNVFGAASHFNTAFLSNLNAQSKKKYDDVIVTQNEEKQNVQENIDKINLEYKVEMINLNKKLKDYNLRNIELEKKENLEYNNRIKAIKDSIKRFKAICKSEVAYELDKINKEYKIRIKEAEEEKITKLKMTK